MGGPAEIILNGVTGLLIQPESPEDLAQALTTLAGDAEARRQMGLAGRQRLLDEYHYLETARKHVAFYEDLIG